MTEQAFEAMMRQYERLVYTVCWQMVHDHHLAQDLTQETFLAAYLHADDCPEEAYRPWLCRIAMNKAKDHLKSAYSRRVSIAETPGDTAAALAEAHVAPTPESVCELRDEAGRAKDQIEALAEPYRAVCMLYFERELPVEAIAARLGRMPKTVHTQLYRAKKQLRLALAAG